MSAPEEIIRFENIHKSFGANQVYQGLDLTVYRGETLTVIGGSGSGKSVLLKTLIGLEYPDEGRVYFEGDDVTQFDEKRFRRLRQKVGMVFQGAALFDSMTVFENVAYPIRLAHREYPEELIRQQVAQKLEVVNLDPEQVYELRPAELSGGMAKRVGLARAIAVEPQVILWDEPTSGLDPISRRTINTLIVSMQRKLGSTSIVVTHDMASAYAVSDRMAMLAEHRIVDVGTPEQLRSSPIPVVREFLDERAVEG